VSFPFVVSVHDVAAATAAETAEWLADLDAMEVPATLLLIPGSYRGGAPLPADRALVASLHAAAARGHELSLHGLRHAAAPGAGGGPAWRRLVDGVLARGAGEFWTLPEPQARAWLRAGLLLLAAAGIEVAGFTPPGWLASPGTRRALVGLGFRYWTSHLAVHDLTRGAALRMPALSHRPGGRGERAGRHAMVTGARLLSRGRRPFRIALHPADLHRPGLRADVHSAIHAALAGGGRPVTYETLVAARGSGR
jgi:predicted deacetylase